MHATIFWGTLDVNSIQKISLVFNPGLYGNSNKTMGQHQKTRFFSIRNPSLFYPSSMDYNTLGYPFWVIQSSNTPQDTGEPCRDCNKTIGDNLFSDSRRGTRSYDSTTKTYFRQNSSSNEPIWTNFISLNS